MCPSKGHEHRNKTRTAGDRAQLSPLLEGSLFFIFIYGFKEYFEWRKESLNVN